MSTKEYDFVDAITFLMCAFAHQGDGELDQSEIDVIFQNVEGFVEANSGDIPHTDEMVADKLNIGLNWYFSVVENAEDPKEVLNETKNVTKFIKNLPLYSPKLGEIILSFLEKIAHADGEIAEGEKIMFAYFHKVFSEEPVNQ